MPPAKAVFGGENLPATEVAGAAAVSGIVQSHFLPEALRLAASLCVVPYLHGVQPL